MSVGGACLIKFFGCEFTKSAKANQARSESSICEIVGSDFKISAKSFSIGRILKLRLSSLLSYENAEVFKLERKRLASIMPPTPNKEPPRLAQLKLSLWLSVTKSIKIFTELR